MRKKEKTKFVDFKMEFNPGTQKYEPILPLKKRKEKIKKRIDLIDLIILITILIVIGAGIAYLIIKGIKL